MNLVPNPEKKGYRPIPTIMVPDQQKNYRQNIMMNQYPPIIIPTQPVYQSKPRYVYYPGQRMPK